MSILLHKPQDVTFFNSIPNICVAAQDFSDKKVVDVLFNLGQLFVKYNLCSQYGLVMVHRHFDLSSQEILVETMNKDKSVSVALPWHFKGDKAVPVDDSLWRSHNLEAGRFVVAQTWSFNETGQLQAFEYFSSNEETVEPPNDFVAELLQNLRELGLEKMVGLRRIRSRPGESSWEVTPKDLRASITKFGSSIPQELIGEYLIPVVWYFDGEGNIRGTEWCGICTNNFCQTCTHTR